VGGGLKFGKQIFFQCIFCDFAPHHTVIYFVVDKVNEQRTAERQLFTL
jgi:hypothetical protein